MYSAVAPLLAHYADRLALGKAAAGVLTASYAGGMLAGSVLGGAVVHRAGPRTTAIGGFALLASASLAFGFAGDIVLLDAARAAQGFGAGLIWSGMLAWLIGATPDGSRGTAIGAAMGAAIFGTVFGPVLGTAAVVLTPAIAFAVVALGAGGMAVLVARLPPPREGAAVMTCSWVQALRSRRLAVVFAYNLLPGLMMGAVNTLVPLRLDAAGASSAIVGGVFLIASVVGGVSGPLVGRYSDRRGGTRRLMVLGLSTLLVAMAGLAVVSVAWAIAAMTVLAIGLAAGIFSIPALALLSRVAESAGLAAGASAVMINISFGGGEFVGAPLSALAAEQAGDAVPFALLGGAALAGAALLLANPQVGAPASAVIIEGSP